MLAGSLGLAYDPSTPEGLFQDVDGAVPVAADGDPVALMRDRSGQGHDAVQPDPARRPVWRTDGARGWLAFDGADDEMQVPAAGLSTAATSLLAVVELSGNGYFPMILGDVSLSDGFTCGFGNGGARVPRFGVSGHAPVVLTAGAAQPVGQRAAMLYGWDGATRRLMRDGAELASDAQAAAWTRGTQPLLCYSGSNVLKSPLRFFGAACLDRAPTDAEAALAFDRMGRPLPGGGEALILGDSTVAAYGGAPSVASLVGTARPVVDLAVPGDGIDDQRAAWDAAEIAPRADGWAVVQVGLNDLDPAEAAAAAVARLQSLVDAVRAKAGAVPILVAQLTPAGARLDAVYGADGPAARAKWAALNAAIAGQGPTPVTGVQGRVTAHVGVLDDGTGALGAAYDTGDGIHPNAAGRRVVADAWAAALRGLGIDP